jgi:hypothetical protein
MAAVGAIVTSSYGPRTRTLDPFPVIPGTVLVTHCNTVSSARWRQGWKRGRTLRSWVSWPDVRKARGGQASPGRLFVRAALSLRRSSRSPTCLARLPFVQPFFCRELRDRVLRPRLAGTARLPPLRRGEGLVPEAPLPWRRRAHPRLHILDLADEPLG